MTLRYVKREIVTSEPPRIVETVRILQERVLLHTYIDGTGAYEWRDVPTVGEE